MVRLSLTQLPENSKIVFVTQTKLKKLVVAQLRAIELTVSIFETLYVFSWFYFQGPDRFSVEVGNSEYDGDYIKAGLYNNEQLYQKDSNQLRKRRQLPNGPFLFARGEHWFFDRNLAAEQELVSVIIFGVRYLYICQ